MRRLLVLIPLLTLLACVPAQAKPSLGIADQKPQTFQDPRLQALGLKLARIYVPWDVLTDRATLPIVDEWMAGAKADGMAPLITIARSRREDRKGYKPSPAQLAAEVRRWRARWPGQVKTLSTWNEANLGNKPSTVAAWWLALRRACPGCTVLGADLLDDPNALQWSAAFVKAAGRAPAVWGLHAYNDANTFSTAATRALLKSLPGRIWITETGGVANRTTPRYRFDGCGVAHAAKATKFLLNQIATLSPRIQRIYLYSWSVGEGNLTFDSGLIGPDGRERPALAYVRAYLGLAPAPPADGLSPELGRCKKGTTSPKPPKAATPKPGKAKHSGA